MAFDGQKVDLTAFDTFDLDIAGQKTRPWWIGIRNPNLGKHTIRHDFYLENAAERGNYTVISSFTVIPALPTPGPLELY